MLFATRERKLVRYCAKIWLRVLYTEPTREHIRRFCVWIQKSKEHRRIFLSVVEHVLLCPDCWRAVTGAPSFSSRNRPRL